ncbi:MAG: formylmethanofuran dehydrogenase subunit E family protein [Candidatus Bathyarchaeia archaeon]
MKVEEGSLRRVTDGLLERAVKFHGHLGPFLVIGLKMGLYAEGLLGEEVSSCEVTSIKEKPPFCAVDGLKVAVGGEVKWSPGEGIEAVFYGGNKEKVELLVKRAIIDRYRSVRWEECESKALEVLRESNQSLFEIKTGEQV